LTKETLEFFENTETGMAEMLARMITFLFQEPEKLVANINEIKNQKLSFLGLPEAKPSL
jgi:hypothetical protein